MLKIITKYFFILPLVILLIFSCTDDSNQTKTEINIDSILILPKWDEHLTIQMEVRKTKTVKKHGTSQEGSSISDVELSISQIENKRWHCLWKIKDFEFPAMSNSLEDKMESMLKGFSYDFILDSTGTFVELKNWKEIMEKGQKAVEIVLNEIKKDPKISSGTLLQMQGTLNGMFDTKEKIETYMLQDVRLFFAMSGTEMLKNDTIDELAFTVHPITGELVRQNVQSVYHKAYSDSTCDIRITQSVDEKELFSIMKNSIDKVAGEEKSDEFEHDMSDTKFDLTIVSDYNISLKSGMTQKVISEKNIKIGDNQRIDRIEITLR